MIKLTREEIYRLVWEQPMTEIAKMYKISDVGFRKACIRMNIPTPAIAHWMKVRSGRKVHRPKLPLTWKGKGFIELEERPSGEAVEAPSEKHRLAKKISAERLPFKVPDRLTNPDPLIIAVRESLNTMRDISYPGMAVTDKRQLDLKFRKLLPVSSPKRLWFRYHPSFCFTHINAL